MSGDRIRISGVEVIAAWASSRVSDREIGVVAESAYEAAMRGIMWSELWWIQTYDGQPNVFCGRKACTYSVVCNFGV